MDNQIMRLRLLYFGRAGFLQKENTAEDGTEFPFWPGLLFSDIFICVYLISVCAFLFNNL